MNLLINEITTAGAKWPGTLLAAGATTASLLWLMQSLISVPELILPEITEYSVPNIVLVEREPPPLVRERPVDRPKPPEVIPEVPEFEFETAQAEIGIAPISVAMGPVDTRGMEYGARGPIPLMIAPAEYPRAALNRGTQGFVELEFDVSATGMAENIRVVRSEPVGVFDKSAVRALSKSKFSPVVKNGQPVPTHNLRHRFIFEVDAQA